MVDSLALSRHHKLRSAVVAQGGLGAEQPSDAKILGAVVVESWEALLV